MTGHSVIGTFAGGDGRQAHGYGTLRKTQLGSDSPAEQSWPYAIETDLEIQADAMDPPDDETEDAVKKHDAKRFAIDHSRSASYRSSAFVNGSTRGLTGIMSGMDPMKLLESFIAEIIKRPRPREQMPTARMAPFSTMSSDMTIRTRPGMTLGSKQGWFGPHPPKDTDPVNFEPAYSLKDVVDNEEDRPLMNVAIEKRRVARCSRDHG